MTTARGIALDRLLSSSTGHPVDQASALIALQACQDDAERAYVVALHLDRRLSWLDWQTVTQRKWQGETRRPSRARHHDSISLREKYVRCGR